MSYRTAAEIDERAKRVRGKTEAEARRIAAARKPRKTYQTTVHGAYGHGIDRVQKVVDRLALLAKRHTITERHYQAALRLRTAHETVYGQVGNVMDFDRARGGGLPGRMPALPYMVASETIRTAKYKLAPRDHAVVLRICVEGYTTKDCVHLFNEVPFVQQQRMVKLVLQDALGKLADFWWPEAKSKPRSHVFRDGVASAGDAGVIEVGGSFNMV